MKKLFTILVVAVLTLTIFAESPQKISYQAVVRNTKGELVTNQSIGMKISIYYFNKTLAITVYSETQTPTTNENGLVSIAIGNGTVVSGIFADIDWAARSFYMKTEIDPGGKTSYSITSDTQIMSVPYALHSKTATTAESTNTLSISGRNIELPYCADIDGNVYATVKIGTQVWMAENLKTTHYRNGVAIPNVPDGSAWVAITTGAWCDYNNLAVNGSKYCHLYNWYAVVDSRNIAPEGWHIPTDAEWTTLENYLIANGGNYDGTTTGDKLGKSLAACFNWKSSTSEGTVGNDLSTNNSAGFVALPGGNRDSSGAFSFIRESGYWWSSTESSTTNAWDRALAYYNGNLNKSGHTKSYGFSVRCLKDD